MSDTPIRVVCVDDNRLIAEAMRQVIDLDPDMQCVGCLYRADGLLDEVVRLRPDVLILDLKMPGRDPIEALRELREGAPNVQTIVCSGLADHLVVDRAKQAGAWGYVEKDGNVMAILNAVRRAADRVASA